MKSSHVGGYTKASRLVLNTGVSRCVLFCFFNRVFGTMFNTRVFVFDVASVGRGTVQHCSSLPAEVTPMLSITIQYLFTITA